jgi:quinoprotein dehydrogenase-associated probable ABC transporter substrate-binding protein
MNHERARLIRRAAFLTSCVLASAVPASAAIGAQLSSLAVCADPGNMPLSNNKGEGFENKIAQLVGKALGTGVQYYWRPSIERGLMRTTLSEGNCDLWMDMASDTEGAEVLSPLYRSTFVLAYRNDKGIDIKSLNDPALKRLRVGVFQVSAIREALSEHGVVDNTVIHYLSHNADEQADNQPSYQVQQVIDGTLDVAAAWGPMAGYYQTALHAPLVIKPVNLMENQVPMEFDMTLAVPRGRPDIKSAVQAALAEHKEEIRQILMDYGVPLVKCDDCLVPGDLPSHGPYVEPQPPVETAADRAKLRRERMAELKKWLAEGANPNNELLDAVVADDIDRVHYLLAHGAHADATDGEGFTALISATMLIRHGAKIDAVDDDGLTSLAIASQNAKINAAEALVGAGADVNTPVAKGGYTPLMLASISGSTDLATSLIGHGAQVNAVNPGGVTALMIAVAANHPNLAALLLKSGADLNARSQDGRTALSIAQSDNNEALVKLLQEAAKGGAPASGCQCAETKESRSES